jgi:hypothetical protein
VFLSNNLSTYLHFPLTGPAKLPNIVCESGAVIAPEEVEQFKLVAGSYICKVTYQSSARLLHSSVFQELSCTLINR